MGLGPDPVDKGDGPVSKIAFCFPGQGSIEAGMGRDIAEAVPDGARGLRARQRRVRPRPRAALLPRRRRGARRHRGAAAGARRDLARGSRRDPRPRHRARLRRRPLGRRVRGARRRRGDARSRTRSRSCASAAWRWPRRRSQHPGSMAAILGLEDEVVETLCRQILGVWPANYNCPGQIVVSGENDAVDECIERAQEEGARRAVKLKVSGAFHSPLVARAADRLRPAIERVKFQEPVAPFMSTVTARLESAQRMAPLLVDQLTAPVRFTQAASRADARRREDVRRGRARATCSPVSSSGSTAASRRSRSTTSPQLDKLHDALAET